MQYYAPLFRALAECLDVTVFYGHRATTDDQARAGFGVGFDWDIDLLSGYKCEFLNNVSASPGLDHFTGVDTPEIGRRLRSGKFETVLLMGWFRMCFHQALWSAKLHGLPVLVRGDSHLDTPRTMSKRWAKELTYPVFLRFFDGALVVGKRNREYWRHYHYPESRMFDSPHCVDNKWFASHATESARFDLRTKLGIAPDVKLVLFAGKLAPFKRPVDVITAVMMTKAQGINSEVMVAGAGPLDQELKAAARVADVRLHILGFCNQSEMPGAYAASDVLVLPSERESWGLVVNEALACGKPVVVSDAVGCAPDVAAHFGDSSVFPTGDTLALATSLKRVFQNPTDPALISSTAAAFSVEAACAGIESAVAAVSAPRKMAR